MMRDDLDMMTAYRFISRYFRNNRRGREYNGKWFIIEILQLTGFTPSMGLTLPRGFWFTECGDITELDDAAIKIYLKKLFPDAVSDEIDSAITEKFQIFKLKDCDFRFQIYQYEESKIPDLSILQVKSTKNILMKMNGWKK